MKAAKSSLYIFLMMFLVVGFIACDNEPEPAPAPATPPPATPTPPPAPCPCEDGCCDTSGQCKSDWHCIDFPLVNQEPVDEGMKCTFEIKGIECMDCCNLYSTKLQGQGTAPNREGSTLERSDSGKDVPATQIGNVTSSGSTWESAQDTEFGCGGNPIGCGDGAYTGVLIFRDSCPEVIELCFRLP